MSRKTGAAALWLVLAAMAASNALLIRQNLQLRRELEKAQPQGLRVGDKVPPFTSDGLDGETLRVGYEGAGPSTMFLYFTPSCVFCREQFAFWREALGRASGGGYEVVGLVDRAEDKTRLVEYLREMGCAADSRTPLRVALVPEEVRRDYHLSATPITLIVSNDGTVRKVWVGRWTEAEKSDAGSALGFNFSARTLD